MRVIRRTASASACALLLMTASLAAEPDHHGKTIQQCDAELRAGRAALTAAGESAAKFIHDCWWRTKAGQPTPIPGSQAAKPDETAAKLKKADDAIAKARAEADAARAEAAQARQEASEARKAIEAAKVAPPQDTPPAPAVATPRKMVEAPHADHARAPEHAASLPRRFARRQPLARTIFVPPRIVERVPRRLAVARQTPARVVGRARPVALVRPSEGQAAAPLVNWVPVHIASVPRPIRWPVFPAFVPSFREAVNHPIVPGFTSTP